MLIPNLNIQINEMPKLKCTTHLYLKTKKVYNNQIMENLL